ncbi:hypothetical protein Tco_0665520 [Tanacetum coccineum]
MINGESFSQLYDDDVVGLCCLGILQLVILGVESTRVIPDWMLRLANDRLAWDKYPWGSYVWPTLYSQLRNAIVKRWSPLYVDQPTDEDDAKKYSIFGYTWAFKFLAQWSLKLYGEMPPTSHGPPIGWLSERLMKLVDVGTIRRRAADAKWTVAYTSTIRVKTETLASIIAAPTVISFHDHLSQGLCSLIVQDNDEVKFFVECACRSDEISHFWTTKMVKSVNACTILTRKLAVTKLAETYRAMLQDWYFKRQEVAGPWHILLFIIPSPNVTKLIGFTRDDQPIVDVDTSRHMLHPLQVYERTSQEFHNVGIEADGGSFFIGPYKESLILLNV